MTASREDTIRALHDALGTCDYCGEDNDYAGCDIRCQLTRAYDAGHAAGAAAEREAIAKWAEQYVFGAHVCGDRPVIKLTPADIRARGAVR